MDRKELLIAYTKRLWMANTANDITGLLLDYEKDLKLIEEREQVKNCSIPDVSNLLCGSFEPDNKTSSATRCKCGREIWEHPKAT